MIAGVSDDVQLHEEELFELQADSGLLQFLGVLRIMDGAQGFVALHQVEWGSDKVGDGFRQRRQLLQQGPRQFLKGA